MNPSTSTPPARRPGRRPSTWRRWAGLLLASALALSGAVTLPSDPAAAASKVPNVAALAGNLTKQKLTWETCDLGRPD